MALHSKGGTQMTHRSVLGSIGQIGLLSWLIAASGCAHPSAQHAANRDVITYEEIAESTATNVYRLIESVRPNWLQKRGAMTVSTVEDDDGAALEDPEIVVYLDGSRLGSTADLETVSTAEITSIRWLNAREATQRFGTGHSRGAILVVSDP